MNRPSPESMLVRRRPSPARDHLRRRSPVMGCAAGFGALLLLIGFCPSASAARSASANYSIEHHSLEGLAGRVQSERYTMDAAITPYAVAQQDSGGGAVLHSGVAAQLNDPPRADHDLAETPVDQLAVLRIADLVANDFDLEGDAFTLSLPALVTARGGSLRHEGDSIIYTAPDGRTAPDAFAYRITDASGLSAEGRVFIVPTDPLDNVVELQRAANELSMTFVGLPGESYRLQYRAAMDAANPWRDFPEDAPFSEQADEAGVYRFTAPVAGLQGYFRPVRVSSNLLEFSRRANGLTLSFRGEPGARYRLQFRQSLDAEEPWSDYAGGWAARANSAGVFQFRPQFQGTQGYFRAVPDAP